MIVIRIAITPSLNASRRALLMAYSAANQCGSSTPLLRDRLPLVQRRDRIRRVAGTPYSDDRRQLALVVEGPSFFVARILIAMQRRRFKDHQYFAFPPHRPQSFDHRAAVTLHHRSAVRSERV